MEPPSDHRSKAFRSWTDTIVSLVITVTVLFLSIGMAILTRTNTGPLSLFNPEYFRNWEVSVAVGFIAGSIVAILQSDLRRQGLQAPSSNLHAASKISASKRKRGRVWRRLLSSFVVISALTVAASLSGTFIPMLLSMLAPFVLIELVNNLSRTTPMKTMTDSQRGDGAP